MKVYSLLGFVDGGTDLLGVFGSVEDVLKCVDSGKGKWHLSEMGYVVSELGEKIDDVFEVVEYVEFERYSFKSGVVV